MKMRAPVRRAPLRYEQLYAAQPTAPIIVHTHGRTRLKIHKGYTTARTRTRSRFVGAGGFEQHTQPLCATATTTAARDERARHTGARTGTTQRPHSHLAAA